VAALALLGALSAACERAPLYAPTGTTIRLTANTQVLAINGTAEITASVLEPGGYAVQNGTMVTFTTSLGTVVPTEVGTTDGRATVVFKAGTQAGTAVIHAYSGANSTTGSTTTGTGGATTTTGTGVTIVVGAAAVNTLVLTASPSSLSQLGGTSLITATVYDANNNALPGVLVAFSTDQGTLAPVSAVTSASGQAQTSLSTTQAATVTATVGAKSGTVKVGSNAVPAVTITGPATTPTVGVSANFTLTVAAGSGAAPIRSVVVYFGDGLSTSLGAATGTITVPHVYLAADQYTITATATDSIGQSTTAAVPVTVFPAVPFTVTVNPSTLTAVINVTTVAFTATPNAGAPAVTSYTWDFGDGILQSTGATPLVSHLYTAVPNGQATQQVLVTVTATGGGRTGYGSCIVTVTR